MRLTRREFIKTNAIAAAAGAAGMSIPGVAMAAVPQSTDGVRWDKGVCRYCGTGCGVGFPPRAPLGATTWTALIWPMYPLRTSSAVLCM